MSPIMKKPRSGFSARGSSKYFSPVSTCQRAIRQDFCATEFVNHDGACKVARSESSRKAVVTLFPEGHGHEHYGISH